MIEVISEYFYCLIYVIALTFTASYLLEEKVKFKRVVIMAPLYAIVNYLVAGATSNNFLGIHDCEFYYHSHRFLLYLYFI